MADERRTWHCPRCGDLLERSGLVGVPGVGECPVFQCDRCVCGWDFDGAVFPTALTFAVGPDGRPFNPETGGPELPAPLAP